MGRIFLLSLLLIGLPAQAALRIFACQPEWAALAGELGGELVEAEAAVTAFQDVHYIQARPSLIAGVRRADLVICTGADLEVAWLPLLLRQAANPRVQPGQRGYLAAADFVELKEKPKVIDRALGDIHPYGNPHIQLDPRNIAGVAEALAARLAELDPPNAAIYRSRHAEFDERWRRAIARWQERLMPVHGMQIVTHHKSWIYLLDWAGLEEVGNLEPKPGVPPSTTHLAELLARIEHERVRLIVRSAYEDSRASEWLSRRTGIPAVVLPQTVGAVPGTEDLFGLFDTIIERLLQAAE